MTGDSDYLLRIVVPDVAAYEQFLKQSLTRIEGVAGIKSSFALKQVKYSRSCRWMPEAQPQGRGAPEAEPRPQGNAWLLEFRISFPSGQNAGRRGVPVWQTVGRADAAVAGPGSRRGACGPPSDRH